jgi:methyltransferase (TIGR00027 family)
MYTHLPEPYNLAPDPFAASLVPAILGAPARAVGLVPWAAPAVHRALGAVAFGLTQHVALRTRAIDDALREGILRGAAQVIVLGAGLDSRAERLDELAGARVFEVDHPSSQRYKLERLAKAGARPRARAVERVAIDFERDRLDLALRSAGLDPDEKSFWIWEGVTVYLTPDAIRETLRAVGELAAPGSRLAVTYSRAGIHGRPSWYFAAASKLATVIGEPTQGLLKPDQIEELLGDAGFAPISDESVIDWTARYWPFEVPSREWERLAIAERR